jgi:predicted glycogen debranching enzyme
MTLRPLLQLKKHPRPSTSTEAQLEWLVTNGLGGYASGTVHVPPARRFHGLLVAAHPAPLGRIMLLHDVEEVADVPGIGPVRLRPWPGAGEDLAPGAFHLEGGLPRWTFTLTPDACVEQAVVMPHGQNTVHLRYRLVGAMASVRLRVRPWLDFRAHEGALVAEQAHVYRADEVTAARCEFKRDDLSVVLRMAVSGAASSFAADGLDRHGVPYAVEEARGYDHVGSMHAPGVFDVVLSRDQDVFVTATSDAWSQFEALDPVTACELELTRRERLLASSHPALQTPETFLLPLAADQFVVRPATRVLDEAQAHAAGAEPRTIIAGYHWFTDWGRDTMISLDGLTLVTGRHDEARNILRSFALHVRHGLIPNMFPEGEQQGLYHTADATLWFFHALHRYDTVSGDHSLVDELLPVLEEIVRCHREGTSFNIHVDEDGLLTQGTPDLQLTWMDAKMGDWVVTPRRGKPVEINALWHNALVLLQAWLTRAGRGLLADDLAREARRCREAFNARFWNAQAGHLYDVVDGDEGDDAACRPNQVVALAVAHSPLDRSRWEPVLEAVASQLLTPVGLRSLSSRHPAYQPRYFGDLRARDGAYHQGTVWPWLIGPFLDAWLAVHPDDTEGVRLLLQPLLDHLVHGACVGSISEIFDAEAPFTPRGCIAQAWSVAEVARLVARTAG